MLNYTEINEWVTKINACHVITHNAGLHNESEGYTVYGCVHVVLTVNTGLVLYVY